MVSVGSRMPRSSWVLGMGRWSSGQWICVRQEDVSSAGVSVPGQAGEVPPVHYHEARGHLLSYRDC